jgi:hypothetical protein
MVVHSKGWLETNVDWLSAFGWRENFTLSCTFVELLDTWPSNPDMFSHIKLSLK